MEYILMEASFHTIQQDLACLTNTAAQNNNFGVYSGAEAAQELSHIVIELGQDFLCCRISCFGCIEDILCSNIRNITQGRIILRRSQVFSSQTGNTGGRAILFNTTILTAVAGNGFIGIQNHMADFCARTMGTMEELSTLMTVEVQLVIDTDSMASYQSENGYYMVTLSLENKTRDEFDAMVADTTVWTAHAGVGEAAYWGVDQTELVAYQDGYAFSVSGYHVYYGCMESIMKKMLASLA